METGLAICASNPARPLCTAVHTAVARSLTEGKHYLSINESDIFDVIESLEKPSQLTRLQTIADAAQRFAYR